MAYIVMGDHFIDSEEVLKKIKENTQFKMVKDLTKGSKREDTLIFQIIQDVKQLKLELDLEGQAIDVNEEELIEELMSLADETAYMVEDFIPEDAICYVYSYHYDEGSEEIKTIVVAADEVIGGLRLRDVAERILRSVD
ncbi:hypothetical protein KQI88_17565 [Alkaliphilus sp. MSJ-5]|uniref:Uncharacterized protein n=1 Tax=Alkaliphilus flagellatus TaxID=2841507 RepID=A0ABS6G7W5_9FIRM|nr:hypothetical protein [Alkaliphilus flagellatus]MBU5678221.1 hypothetical protein [Alkaliphilus flagellatus]